MKRNPQEHICSDAAHQQCICEQESKARIACPVFFGPHLAISNCTSKAAVKPTQLHRCHLLPKLQGSIIASTCQAFQKVQDSFDFQVSLTSRSCRSSCSPLRSYSLPDRFCNSCSTLRTKIFCATCFRAAIEFWNQQVVRAFALF